MDIKDIENETTSPEEDAKQRQELADNLKLEEKNSELDEVVEEEQDGNEDNQAEEADYKALYEAEHDKLLKESKRRVASSKEAKRLFAENKQLKAEKAKASVSSEVTEEVLKKKYQDWDDMTAAEQKAIKRAEMAEARAAAAENIASKYDGIEEFNDEMEDFLELAEAEGKFIDVREQIDDFRKFARQNRGRDLEELAKIFSFDHPKKESKKYSAPIGNSARKAASGGEKPKLSDSQLADLRRNDPRRYEDLLEKGEI